MDYKITKWEAKGVFDSLQVEYRRGFGGGDQDRAGITLKPYTDSCMIDCVSGTEHYIWDWDRRTDGDGFTIRIGGEGEREAILKLFKFLIKEMEGDEVEREAELDILYPNRKKSRGL